MFDIPHNEATHVSFDGSEVSLDLKANNVPECAKEVIIYARVSTGWIAEGYSEGNLIVQSSLVKRQLYFRTYQQSAFSYNSEYFTMPISFDRRATAKIVTSKRIASDNFKADVQVVGFIM